MNPVNQAGEEANAHPHSDLRPLRWNSDRRAQDDRVSLSDRRTLDRDLQRAHCRALRRLGIWLGLKLTKKKEVLIIKEVPVPSTAPFSLNEQRLKDLGITKRELEILELIAQGMSNREIAEKLFVSENTVKTHSSRLFDKLGAKRRTQAVQIGKEMGLIP